MLSSPLPRFTHYGAVALAPTTSFGPNRKVQSVGGSSRVSDLRFGEHSVMEYVAELQRLWADLDHYAKRQKNPNPPRGLSSNLRDPLELQHADCTSSVKKWIECMRVIEFLKGLNSEFEGRQATMFHQPTLPNLAEAIAAIAQEEVRLKVMKNNVTIPSRRAFIVT